MLTITVDQRAVTRPDGQLTFGRDADLLVGADNRSVHRLVGRFLRSGGVWWLENLGSHVALVLTDPAGVRTELAGHGVSGLRASVPLPAGQFQVQFRAAGTDYRLLGEVGDRGPGPVDPPEVPASATTELPIRLTVEEQALVDTLARPVLAAPDRGPDALPSNRAVARELGWTVTKLNRKLDYLCLRMSRLGFDGLRGALGDEATLRRWRLVQHAQTHGLLSAPPPTEIDPDPQP